VKDVTNLKMLDRLSLLFQHSNNVYRMQGVRRHTLPIVLSQYNVVSEGETYTQQT